MSINGSIFKPKYVSTEYCNRYTVCWQESPWFPWAWKYKTFARKKDAKEFAKRMRKTSPRKPYISKDIVLRSYFRSDIEVEFAKLVVDVRRTTEKSI